MQKSVKQKHLDCLLGKFSYIHLVISAGSDLPQSFMAKNLCNFILSETKTVIRFIDTSWRVRLGHMKYSIKCLKIILF